MLVKILKQSFNWRRKHTGRGRKSLKDSDSSISIEIKNKKAGKKAARLKIQSVLRRETRKKTREA